MRIVRVIGVIGRVLVAVGLALLFYTTFLLWGTGVETKRAQSELAQQLQARPPTVTEFVADEIPPARPAAEVGLGDALWHIAIPKIGLRTVVVSGVEAEQLKRGPGHFPDAPYPGEPGNVAISGHRTTFGAPFYRLNELEVGDEIVVESGGARYRYAVDEVKIVAPTAVEVIDFHGRDEITLTTCHPRFSAAQRLVVHAPYVGAEPIAGPPEGGGALPDPVAQEIPEAPAPVPADVFGFATVSLVGLLGAMFLSDRLRRTAVWSAGTAASAAVLWTGVFPQILRLMPPNY